MAGFCDSIRPLSVEVQCKMRKNPFDAGPPEDLTTQEIEALASIKQGHKVAARMCSRLEMLDLAQESLCGWALTPEGDWRLGLGH